MAIQVPAEAVSEDIRLRAVMRSGAAWFFWIAGLSLVNTVMSHTGNDLNFLMGLAFTVLVDIYAKGLIDAGGPEAAIRIVAIGLDVVVAGLFALFAVFGQRGRPWAFLAGIAVYALDALVFVSFSLWANVAFHAFAGFYLLRGYGAQRALSKMVRPAASAVVDVPAASAGPSGPDPGSEPRRNPLVR